MAREGLRHDSSACSSDEGCKTGGTFDDGANHDDTRQYRCDTTSGACERPVPATLSTVGPGGSCFDSFDCATVACIGNTCSGFCTDSPQECAAIFGSDAGKVYCMADYVGQGFPACCLPLCSEPASAGYYWDQSNCVAFFGGGATCNNSSHRCVAP